MPIRLIVAFVIGVAIALACLVVETFQAVGSFLLVTPFKLISFKRPRPLKPIYRESWRSHGHNLTPTPA